ncbi:MAG: alpha/beta hydrolase [Pseudomonadota bacterium]
MRPQPGFVPHVTTLGNGPRRALALHCTLAFGGAWAGVARALGDQVTLVAPDMPSHGQSADWDEVSDFSDTVFEASAALLEDAPMDIIGHSFGAATALRLAVAYPEKVRSMVLAEPVLFVVGARDAPELMDGHRAGSTPFFFAISAGDRENAARLFNGMWSARSVWEEMPERSRAAMVRAIHVVPDTYPFLYEDSAGLLQPGRLEALDIPTVMLRGAQAQPLIQATNAGLARRLGNATEAVIDGAGHMAPISHPGAVAEVIAGLFARS